LRLHRADLLFKLEHAEEPMAMYRLQGQLECLHIEEKIPSAIESLDKQLEMQEEYRAMKTPEQRKREHVEA
jgi:hypothetical protein